METRPQVLTVILTCADVTCERLHSCGVAARGQAELLRPSKWNYVLYLDNWNYHLVSTVQGETMDGSAHPKIDLWLLHYAVFV